eukprot:766486-Hanusia_phi.AAC.2
MGSPILILHIPNMSHLPHHDTEELFDLLVNSQNRCMKSSLMLSCKLVQLDRTAHMSLCVDETALVYLTVEVRHHGSAVTSETQHITSSGTLPCKLLPDCVVDVCIIEDNHR